MCVLYSSYYILLYFTIVNYRFKEVSSFGASFVALSVSYIFLGLGIAADLQGRIIALWFLFNLALFNVSRKVGDPN